MELTLTLEGGPAPVTDRTRRILRGQLRVGRGAGNDWVLDDPERYLSKHHCTIAERGGEWWITDESTNGVFVDDQARPLGRGNSARLRDGGWVRIGDYRLRIQIATPGEASPHRIFDQSHQPDRPEPEPAPPPRTTGSVFETEWRRKWSTDEPDQPARPPADRIARFSERSPFEELDDRHRESAEKSQRADRRPERSGPPAEPGAPDEAALDPFDLPPQAPPKVTQAPEPRQPPARLDQAPVERPLGTGAEPRSPPDHAIARPAMGDAAALLEAFLDGAGIDPKEVKVDDPHALMRQLGESFQVMAQGLAQLLATRAMIKREIGVSTTLIGGSDNNPLKHSADEHEAVLWLIQHRGPGYLEPKTAIRNALDDIKAHELAVLEGVQAALKTLLNRFDPAVLEKEIKEHSVLSRIAAGGRKAKYWQIFKEHYADIAKTAQTRFLGEIGPYFAEAYERKVHRC
jgi:type VI secretion system protein ImpI